MINYTKQWLELIISGEVSLAKKFPQDSHNHYEFQLTTLLRFSMSLVAVVVILSLNVSVFAQSNLGEQDATLVFQPDIQPQSSNLNNEGACIVKFDIDTIGKTQNIRSNCSSEDFSIRGNTSNSKLNLLTKNAKWTARKKDEHVGYFKIRSRHN